jgi:hypothetical protein
MESAVEKAPTEVWMFCDGLEAFSRTPTETGVHYIRADLVEKMKDV